MVNSLKSRSRVGRVRLFILDSRCGLVLGYVLIAKALCIDPCFVFCLRSDRGWGWLYMPAAPPVPLRLNLISKCQCEKSSGLFVFGVSFRGSFGRRFCVAVRTCWQYEVVDLG